MEDRPNWVKQRAECHLDVVFARLCQEVEFDVEEMQKYASQIHHPGSFRTDKSGDRLQVFCDSQDVNVMFAVEIRVDRPNDAIIIEVQESGPRSHSHTIKAKWDEKHEQCILYCDKDSAFYWAVCKRIFEPLFFSSVDRSQP